MMQYHELGTNTAKTSDWLNAAGHALYAYDLSIHLFGGAEPSMTNISDAPAIHAENNPVLARIWDNDEDAAAYDDL